MSHADTQVNLDTAGYVLLQGINQCDADCSTSNGSGKSSIWDALSWCLTGETIRGAKDVTRKSASEGCRVTLSFSVDSDEYVLIRCKDDSEYKTNLKIYVNGEDRSGKGIRDSEKILQAILPDISSQLLGNVVILGQGLPVKFSNYTPSGRKDLLEKLSKSDFMIEDLKDRVSTRELALIDDTAICQANIRTLESKILNDQNQLTQLKQKYDEIFASDINSSIEELQELKNKTTALLTRNDLLNKSIIDVSHEVDLENSNNHKLRQAYFDARDSISNDPNEELTTIENSIAACKATLYSNSQELTRILNIRDICPTCGQKIIGVMKPDTTSIEAEISRCKDSLKTLEDNKQQIVGNINLKLNELKVKYDALIEESNIKIRQFNESKNAYLCEISTNNQTIKYNNDKIYALQTLIDNYQNNLTTIQTNIEDLNIVLTKSISELDTEKGSYESVIAHKAVIDKFKTILSRNFRGLLLQNCINYISTVAQDYAQEVFNHRDLAICLDGNAISIKFNGKEYESLSGGEQKKVDIIIQLAIRNMLCNYLNFNCNIIVLDEVFDALDYIGCEKISNLLTTKLEDVSTMYIVTHRKDLPISTDHSITVTKNNLGISSVI